jgi:enamine deaminase RidA (YjgF/YER057c/UK114 family)
MKAINPEGATIPGIWQAVRVETGKLLFLSGHVPFREDGSLAGPDLAAQLLQVMTNIRRTLGDAGTDFSRVARLTLYVRDYDPADLETIRRVRDDFVDPDLPPASALIGVAALFHPDVRVEVDAVVALE